jgi:hypothetical protein
MCYQKSPSKSARIQTHIFHENLVVSIWYKDYHPNTSKLNSSQNSFPIHYLPLTTTTVGINSEDKGLWEKHFLMPVRNRLSKSGTTDVPPGSRTPCSGDVPGENQSPLRWSWLQSSAHQGVQGLRGSVVSVGWPIKLGELLTSACWWGNWAERWWSAQDA